MKSEKVNIKRIWLLKILTVPLKSSVHEAQKVKLMHKPEVLLQFLAGLDVYAH